MHSLRLPVLLPVSALLLTLVACSGDDDSGGGGGGGASPSATPAGTETLTSLEQALAVLPASTSGVTFVDRVAVAQRLDLPDDFPAADYAAVAGYDVVAGTPMLDYLAAMDEAGAAVDERDVLWSAAAQVDGADGPVTVYRVGDEVDLGALVDDLAERGFTEDEVDGRPHLVAPDRLYDDQGTLAGAYALDFYDVVVDAEAHLVVSGADADQVLDVVDGDADSLATAGSVTGVLEGVGDVQRVALAAPAVCQGAGSRERAGLGTPRATAVVHSGEPLTASARLQFSDEQTAKRDLRARKGLLGKGTTVTRAGTVVVADLPPEDAQSALDIDGDGPLVCGASGRGRGA